jgi:hypothetical protein
VLPFTLPLQESIPWWVHVTTLFACTFPVALFYDSSQRVQGRSGLQRLLDVPSAMALGIGMSVSQTQAVFEGLGRNTGVFVRTPKRGEETESESKGYSLGLPGWSITGATELLLALWSAWALLRAAQLGLWGAMPFLFLFFAGFAWVGTLTVAGSLSRR